MPCYLCTGVTHREYCTSVRLLYSLYFTPKQNARSKNHN